MFVGFTTHTNESTFINAYGYNNMSDLMPLFGSLVPNIIYGNINIMSIHYRNVTGDKENYQAVEICFSEKPINAEKIKIVINHNPFIFSYIGANSDNIHIYMELETQIQKIMI